MAEQLVFHCFYLLPYSQVPNKRRGGGQINRGSKNFPIRDKRGVLSEVGMRVVGVESFFNCKGDGNEKIKNIKANNQKVCNATVDSTLIFQR